MWSLFSVHLVQCTVLRPIPYVTSGTALALGLHSSWGSADTMSASWLTWESAQIWFWIKGSGKTICPSFLSGWTLQLFLEGAFPFCWEMKFSVPVRMMCL